MLITKRTLALTAALTLLAAGPAAARTSHKYTATVRSAPVSTSASYPNPGGAALFTGSVTSKQLGPGTLTDLLTVYSHPEPNVFLLQGGEVDRFARGRIFNTFTGRDTVNADGSQSVVIHGRITGGTGRYKGATGQYTFTGTTQPGSTVLKGHSHGRVTF